MRVVLKVRHRGEAKLVGKVFEVQPFMQRGKTETVFLHVGGEKQWHRKLDSPGGIDLCVLEALEAYGVDEIHHEVRETGVLYVAPVERVRKLGVVQRSDGRVRVYLPASGWEEYPKKWYRPPYITDEKVVGDDPLAAAS